MEKENADAEVVAAEASEEVKTENGPEETSDLSSSLPNDEEDSKGNSR